MSGARRRSHGAIEANARRAAGGFRARGIAEGDAVALLMRNDFAFFEASRGAVLAGAYPVPINWHSGPDETAYILADCGARTLVAHEDLIGALHGALPPGLPVLVVPTPPEIRAAYGPPATAAEPPGTERWEAWLAAQAPIAAPAGSARSAVIYTSGTTGRPKGVRREAGGPAKPTRALAVYGFDRDGPATALITGPMYHSVPNAYARLAFQAGAEIVLQPRFDAEGTLDAIARHRVSHLHLVPAMLVRLLRLPHAVRERYDLSSLRHVVHGAAPCPPAVKAAMIDWWGPVIHEYYGSTETGLLTLADPADARRRPGTVGRALPGIALRVLGRDGEDIGPGEAGTVYAGSDSLHAFSYLGAGAARAEISRGDLVTAGDVGWLDADGYLFLRDRGRDAIPVGGAPVYPADVEAALLANEDIADCAVFGVPDAAGGETICAYVVAGEGRDVDAETLRAGLTATLTPAQVPADIVVVPTLPREDSGKVFKQRLRAIEAGRGGGRRHRPAGP